MTHEVGRLHRERQVVQNQIADLFAFYTKQKEVLGPHLSRFSLSIRFRLGLSIRLNEAHIALCHNHAARNLIYSCMLFPELATIRSWSPRLVNAPPGPEFLHAYEVVPPNGWPGEPPSQTMKSEMWERICPPKAFRRCTQLVFE